MERTDKIQYKPWHNADSFDSRSFTFCSTLLEAKVFHVDTVHITKRFHVVCALDLVCFIWRCFAFPFAQAFLTELIAMTFENCQVPNKSKHLLQTRNRYCWVCSEQFFNLYRGLNTGPLANFQNFLSRLTLQYWWDQLIFSLVFFKIAIAFSKFLVLRKTLQ